jgi:hypothetical protein
MKRFWLTTLSVFIALFILLPTFSNATELGEFCWRGVDSDDGDIHVERMQVTQHGQYFSVNGREVDDDGDVTSFSGSGYIEGGMLKLGMTAVVFEIDDGSVDTEPQWVEIELSDLSGTMKYSDDASSTLTHITCP